MVGEQSPRLPLIFVSTGTDKRFPFIRLVRWVEAWAGHHKDEVAVLVQAGITPSLVLPSVKEYQPDEMKGVLARSDAAVLQGGPGGMMNARANGLMPILVPRRGQLGEAVDDHQVDFGRWAAKRGLTVTVETEAALHAALDVVLEDRLAYAIPPEASLTQQTVERIEDRISRLLADTGSDPGPERSDRQRASVHGHGHGRGGGAAQRRWLRRMPRGR
jgi:UDP-N-acetylglucosamine transferase subunit ALG13